MPAAKPTRDHAKEVKENIKQHEKDLAELRDNAGKEAQEAADHVQRTTNENHEKITEGKFEKRDIEGEADSIKSPQGIIEISPDEISSSKDLQTLVRQDWGLTYGCQLRGGDFFKMRKDEIESIYPDIKKANKLLKWRPKISFNKGLIKTIKYYLDYERR